MPFTDLNATVWMNVFLWLPTPSGPVKIGSETYTRTSPDNPGKSFTLGVGASGTGTSSAAGFEYVMAKYDGYQGGAIIYYAGGASLNLSSTSKGLWEDSSKKGYSLTGWKAFNPTTAVSVFDGGSTMILLGLATLGLGALRRFSN
jgi:hypothetical protein